MFVSLRLVPLGVGHRAFVLLGLGVWVPEFMDLLIWGGCSGFGDTSLFGIRVLTSWVSRSRVFWGSCDGMWLVEPWGGRAGAKWALRMNHTSKNIPEQSLPVKTHSLRLNVLSVLV